MQKDPTAEPMHRLLVAHANYEMACAAKTTTRELLDGAIVKAAAAGLSHAEIGRAIGATGQRIGQIVAEAA
jgi:hypothetical protein